ncbi:hypothetical protein HC891_10855 [Candidatus Gracilibacteria bacterium]|nr:hypothetical protein [Candidatus Gracilibacteria bacterium]
MHRLKSSTRLILFAGIVVIALTGFWLFQSGSRAVTASERAAAEARWQAQSFAAYRISYREQSGRTICQQELLVTGEAIDQVVLNRCNQPATWTVSKLFRWIEGLEGERSRCFPGPGNCICRVAVTTAVDYDAQRGYPTEVRYAWTMGPNWGHGDYWRTLLTNPAFPGCSRPGFGGPVRVMVVLEPLP